MRIQRIAAATVLAASIAIAPSSAFSMNPVVVAAIVKLGQDMADITNTGDGKALILWGLGSHCGKPKGDHTFRSQQIAQKIRAMRDAGQSGDADAIFQSALDFQATLDRSSMFESCFHSMAGWAKIASVANQIIAQGKNSQ